jgi:hypothetical protein
MNYRAVGNRCVVDLNATLRVDYGGVEPAAVKYGHTMDVLTELGFVQIEVNLVDLARETLPTLTYRRGARMAEAPQVMDCSSFVKWLYGQKGIWLPRRSIQQAEEVGFQCSLDELLPGDLIFTGGVRPYFADRFGKTMQIGHVAMATGEGTIIHATNSRTYAGEVDLDDFVASRDNEVKQVVRIIHAYSNLATFEFPASAEVESSDDVKWLLLQRLN